VNDGSKSKRDWRISGNCDCKDLSFRRTCVRSRKSSVENIEAEVQCFDAAIKQSTSELEQIKEHAFKELGEDKAAIFAAHLLVLSDPELINPIKDKVYVLENIQ
jgi:phosphoenolpyruvate-protein kinase (PTS system EI component)